MCTVTVHLAADSSPASQRWRGCGLELRTIAAAAAIVKRIHSTG